MNYARSSKQKHITKSSTAAELVTLDETATTEFFGMSLDVLRYIRIINRFVSRIKAGKPTNL